jgi:hypothetical protein
MKRMPFWTVLVMATALAPSQVSRCPFEWIDWCPKGPIPNLGWTLRVHDGIFSTTLLCWCLLE